MTMTSLGDLAQSVMLRQQSLTVRQNMNRFAQEVTTGLTSNLTQHLKGDFSYLSDIERNLSLITAFRTSTLEAASISSGMQTALAGLQDVATNLGSVLLTSANYAQQSVTKTAADDSWEQSVAVINTQFAGRSLFAGNATDRPALANAAVIMDALRNHIGTETSALEIRSLVDQWFDTAGGGYDTVAYLGSQTGLAPHRLDSKAQVNLDLRADASAFRDVLKFTALAVIATDSFLNLPDAEIALLQRQSGQGLIQSQETIAYLRADLGFAEAKIEDSRVRLASERTSLELARNELISIDPFNTATRLAEAQTQLESLYAVTARLSRLSLAEYLR